MYVADLHCDTVSSIYYDRKNGGQANLLSNHFQLDLNRMKKGGYLLQNFAVFVDLKNGGDPYRCVFKGELAKYPDKIRQAMTVEDILKNQKEGRISAVLTLEEGEVCLGDENTLEEFYRDGVRMMTFTWNYPNSLATEEGLTSKGVLFLEKMQELGIIPDVSHLPRAGFYDVCRYAKRPFVASHSNAAALCGHKRNLTDDMVRKIAERGGVIGINYYGLFLVEKPENGIYYSSVGRIADHICHMVNVGGTGCVGLGSDFDGIDCNLELSDCSKMGLLEQELKKRGFGEKEIGDIFYRNVLRIYKESFKFSC